MLNKRMTKEWCILRVKKQEKIKKLEIQNKNRNDIRAQYRSKQFNLNFAYMILYYVWCRVDRPLFWLWSVILIKISGLQSQIQSKPINHYPQYIFIL